MLSLHALEMLLHTASSLVKLERGLCSATYLVVTWPSHVYTWWANTFLPTHKAF